MSEKLKALLEGAAQAPVGGGGILVHQFRKILLARQVDEAKWNELMDKYIAVELKDVPQDANRDAQAASIRHNLTIELTQPTMSWKVFLKGLRFLGFTSMEFGVRGEGDDFVFEGTTTIVQMNSAVTGTEANGD